MKRLKEMLSNIYQKVKSSPVASFLLVAFAVFSFLHFGIYFLVIRTAVMADIFMLACVSLLVAVQQGYIIFRD